MSSYPALILLPNFKDYSVAVVGDKAKRWEYLHSLTGATPESFCIPLWTLRAIADANNLKLKLTHLVKSSVLSDPVTQTGIKKQLTRMFDQLIIPDSIGKLLAKTYHDYLRHGFITVSASADQVESITHENVHGESNLIDAVTKLWLELITWKLGHFRQHQAIHELLFVSPLVVQRQPEATASGRLHTLHPQTSNKTQMVIESWWGIIPKNHPPKDTFIADLRTQTVISSRLGRQTTALLRKSDHVTAKPVVMPDQTHASLTEKQIKTLVALAQKIKQHSMAHLTLSWVLEKDAIWITGQKTLETERQTHPQSRQSSPTITKLYISSGNPAQAHDQISPSIDGVGILRGEFTIAQLGLHPNHVLKSHAKNQLKESLIKTMTSYQSLLNGKPLIYRSQNMTSDQLRKLHHASDYEPLELNPYLGYRGGLRIVTQPGLFELELEALEAVLKKNTQPVGLMVPFIRSLNEFSVITKLVAKHKLEVHNHFSFWLQLNTPASIFELKDYLHSSVSGVCLNIKSIHGLLYGINPDNKELLERYPLDYDMMEAFIATAVSTVRKASSQTPLHWRKQILLHLEDYQPSLVELAVKLGVDGVVVKPSVAPIAKACIMDAEAERLNSI